MGDLTKHFSRSEFACKCGKCKPIAVDFELVNVLEKLRSHIGQPITINSAYRCHAHNAAVQGRPASKHLYGIAADIVVKGMPPADVAKYLRNQYPDKYGVGEYKKASSFRKPGPGMILQAANEFDIELSDSVLIGDKNSDIDAGIAAGVGCNLMYSANLVDVSEKNLSTEIIKNLVHARKYLS